MSVDVLNDSALAGVPQEGEIRAWLRQAMQRLPGADSHACEVSVRIVDEQEGRDLNRQFRQIDKATNVLSFPAVADAAFKLPQDAPRMLGDIVVCAPVVEQEAVEQGKALLGHWQHLLIHGLLHLLGYDHESDAEAETMESLEIEILASQGIADPYTSGN